jgi:hypothetical protein
LTATHSYKVISLLLKVVIVGLSLWYIYYKVFLRQDIAMIGNTFTKSISDGNSLLLLAAFLLLFINWGLEAKKWQHLIQLTTSVSYTTSCKAILAGITVSVFTPNRTGEFGGRILFIEGPKRIAAVLITFWSGVAQLLITFIFGAFALSAYFHLWAQPKSPEWLVYFLYLASLLLSVSLTILFYHPSLVARLFSNFRFLQGYRAHWEILYSFSPQLLRKALLLSLARYFVFSFQFFLLLYFFHVNIPFIEGWIMIALTFFTVTAIPTITFTEISIRGSAALVFIGLLSNNHIGIIAASLLLWIINVALPSLAGSYFILRIKSTS